MAEGQIAENTVEDAALEWLSDLGWSVAHGPDIAPGSANNEREDYGETFLPLRLRDALYRLNPDLPQSALDDAYRKLTRPEGASLETRNRAFHRMLIDGVNVEYRQDSNVRGAYVTVVDFESPSVNDWLAVNQFTVVENKNERRADVVLFINGLPLGVIELKNPTDEDATIWSAWQQLQTYKNEIPSLFTANELLVVSDGVDARMGSLTAGREWFKPWRTIEGDDLAKASSPELQVMLNGACEPSRFVRLIRDFVVFDDDGSKLTKKMAGYHQFHAVEVGVDETLRAANLVDAVDFNGKSRSGRAAGDIGDRRIGVVWHTQGSGKSLTMAFYAGRVIREPAMSNPTIVVLTDRNDLDDQLFGTFTRCRDLLRQPPQQAEDRADLRLKLAVESGGVVFTTIQKFFPDEKGTQHELLSDRKNIVVIADEAHRSQYDFIRGYAGHMRDALPNASFIGFTGTPIEQQDANTRAVFGDHISIYDIRQAVDDGATVPIYYESRLARIALDEGERPTIDIQFEEATEGEEIERKEKLKTKWAQLEAVVGTEKRLRQVANDIVAHFDSRTEAMQGKAMIVCMSRRICVDLYDELVRLRPTWQDQDDTKGRIKIVMTGSASDATEWQQHIRNKSRREALANRFRDPNDEFEIVLVRDMWLTGFDAPSLHTMYVDKPMRGHGLMQAIARVNRVFRDKPGGLVVDYLGLSEQLKRALATYTRSGGKGETAVDKAAAIALMMEKYEVCLGILHGFDFAAIRSGSSTEQLSLLAGAQEHVLAQKDGKDRFVVAVRDLSHAYALAVPCDEATKIRYDVGFFQELRAALLKRVEPDPRTQEELDNAVREIISRAVAPEGVIDIFAAAGLPNPDISILSEEFLADVRDLKHRNVAVDLLHKLLKGEVAMRRRTNVVQARSFAEMLEATIRRYQNRSVEIVQVIEELIKIAREMRKAGERGEKLGLSDDEIAFYDALETNDSAVQVLGDETLCVIARELVSTVRSNVTIDWTLRENVRANLRRLVKRILRKYGYPPDKQEKATLTVIEQAEVLSANWVT